MTSPSKSQPQLYHSRRNRYAEVQFAPIRAMETDDSGAISPPLWGNRSPSPSRPLLSPDSRAQAIARGRTELMEMVRHIPESSYELSLKDIVEHHHRAENQIEGGSDRGGAAAAAAGLKKEESRKIERRLSFEDKGFFLNMAFPFAFMSKRRKLLLLLVVVVGEFRRSRKGGRAVAWSAPDPHQHEASNPESAMVSGLRSERLFFEPGATSSALAEAESGGGGRESERGGGAALVVAMNSRDSFLDFRASMAEMVEGGGERDWGFLVKMKNLIKTRNDHYTLS